MVKIRCKSRIRCHVLDHSTSPITIRPIDSVGGLLDSVGGLLDSILSLFEKSSTLKEEDSLFWILTLFLCKKCRSLPHQMKSITTRSVREEAWPLRYYTIGSWMKRQ